MNSIRKPYGRRSNPVRSLGAQLTGWCLWSALLGTGLGLLSGLQAAQPQLTVDPATISNAYTGPITLHITGLTNGEPVLVEKYCDANGDGVVNAGDFLIQSLRIVDGQVTSFTGVRNANIPGDDDVSPNGQITTTLGFAAAAEFERGIGAYLYRLSSPSGNFLPVIRPFTLTATSYPQSVVGTVSSGGSPVTNAFVGILNAGMEGEFVAGTTANSAGAYSINLPPGDYMAVALRDGYVANFASAPQFTLNPGQTATANVTMAAANRTISGKLTDSQSGNGIGGLQLSLQTDAKDFVLGFTDASGNFSLPVSANLWTLQFSERALASLGYLMPYQGPEANTTTGNVSNLSYAVPKGTALIYGSLKDDQTNALAGVNFYGSDSSNRLDSSGISDAAGNYFLAVAAGQWSVGPSSDNPMIAGLVVPSTNITIGAGQAIRVDFVASRVTARLIGRVVDNLASPVSNIGLILSTDMGQTVYQETGPDGSFDLGVVAGTWHLQLESQAAAAKSLIGPELILTVANGQSLSNILYTVQRATAHITGKVSSSTGTPLVALGVYGHASVGGTDYYPNAQTDLNGNYRLAVFNGTWSIGLSCWELDARGFTCPVEQTVTVSGTDLQRNFTVPPYANTRPSLDQVRAFPGQIQFTVTGESGRQYRVETTTDFNLWSGVSTNTAWGGAFQFSAPMPVGAGWRYYRATLVR